MYLKNIINNILICLLIVTSTQAVLTKDVADIFDENTDTFSRRNHPCRRKCLPNGSPRMCFYNFVVEMYTSMGKACYDCPRNVTDCNRPHCIPADGVQKTVYTVNRQMPGPTIEACQNDIIVVDVKNNMNSESTTIHWHGFKQLGTPYMDGVPYVTQCPILPGQSFRYEFNTTTDGTYFYHSHIGNQRVDGLFGALIIHPTYKRIHRKLYDYDDQIMMVNDWAHMGGNAVEVKEYHYRLRINPETILVNGLGRYYGDKSKILKNPLSVFKVTKGKRHRFRMIDAGSAGCPIEMSIDNHTMLIISLDSNSIEPVEVDVISIWPGERVDFVLKADQEPGNYWIRYRGYGQCEPLVNVSGGAFQAAILHYDSVPFAEPLAGSKITWESLNRTETSRVLNPFQTGTESSHRTNLNIPLLKSVEPNDITLTGKVDQKIYISFDFHPKDSFDSHRKGLYEYKQVPLNKRIGTVQLNHISLSLPPFALLSQRDLIKPGFFCNSSTIPAACVKEQCACTHVLELKLNSLVELVFVHEGTYGLSRHPIHLHGHFFRVISTVRLEGSVSIDRVKKLEQEGKVHRNLDRAPIKDTIKTPGGGYTIVRFLADNPGYWFLHCHFEQHTNVGMALVFKVGEHEDFPPVPKNFPTCGNFVPDDDVMNFNNFNSHGYYM